MTSESKKMRKKIPSRLLNLPSRALFVPRTRNLGPIATSPLDTSEISHAPAYPTRMHIHVLKFSKLNNEK